MAGVIASHTKRPRKAPVIASVEAALAGSAERAAIEREPVAADPSPTTGASAGGDPATNSVAVSLPAADAPIDAAVLPEPTLVARPDVPQPIVTASPILAIEPAAIDVVEADAAAARVAAGLEPAADPAGPHAAAAGQPTLTIEESGAERAANRLAEGALGGDVLPTGGVADQAPFASAHQLGSTFFADLKERLELGGRPTPDDVVQALELIEAEDAQLLPVLRAGFVRFFAITEWDDNPEWTEADFARARPASEVHSKAIADQLIGRKPGTVAVVEVVGPPQGRRRAGRSFGPQAVRFLASELSADEIAALRADPLLAVGVTEVTQADIDPALYG